ncbi:hypothetical protein LB579_31250 [Mesorhizobium sp. BR1-1-7]|nr:hypothetical protein [Mesorhizobium sp. BR1-1-7]
MFYKSWTDATHRRWRLPYIARGAIGDKGGHWKALGVECSWNDEEHFGYANRWAISFFRLLSFHHQDTKGGALNVVGKPGWTYRYARPRLTFETRGTNTYG